MHTIQCPNCRAQIPLDQALAAPLIAEARRGWESLHQQKEAVMLAKEAELERNKKLLEHHKADWLTKQKEQLERDREAMKKQADEAAREQVGVELKSLRELSSQQQSKLAESQKIELELRKERQSVLDRQRELDLEVARKVDAERSAIREKAHLELQESHRLKLLENEHMMQAMRRQIDDLKRKSEQGSQQAQGEVLEIELEQLLRKSFPDDDIAPVPKGVHGGDVVQNVRLPGGQICGAVLWEAKRTRNWNEGWLEKLRDDQRTARAELAAIVSTALPEGVSAIGRCDGVWICAWGCAAPLALVLRTQLIELQRLRQSNLGRRDKMNRLYDYMAGPHFKHRVEAVVEAFTSLREDLEQEKRAMQRIWNKREKQIERVLENTAGLHGDVAGIIGRDLPAIESMEFSALERNDEEDESAPRLTLDP